MNRTGPKLNLLCQHAFPSLEHFNQHTIFIQNNVPCDIAKGVKQFLQAKNIEIMKWPAQSPDLNPIEKSLENVIKVMVKKPTTVTELWKTLEGEDQDHTRAV